jgi:tRNA threonylcarbamoyladenosine biosynthesis protein TsaB
MASRMLAVDTSGSVTAVAVLDGDRVLAEDGEAADERHAEILLPRIEQCLARAGFSLRDIDVFAVGIGPGSFTGVRVGVATVKGLAFATGKPVRGVVSLSVLATRVAEHAPGLVAPILDAYKGEVFAALYAVSADETALVLPPFHASPEQAAEQLAERVAGERASILGAGYRRYADRLVSPLVPLSSELDVVRGRDVAAEALRLLREEGPSDLVRLAPLYVRGSDAQLPKEPLRL